MMVLVVSKVLISIFFVVTGEHVMPAFDARRHAHAAAAWRPR